MKGTPDVTNPLGNLDRTNSIVYARLERVVDSVLSRAFSGLPKTDLTPLQTALKNFAFYYLKEKYAQDSWAFQQLAEDPYSSGNSLNHQYGQFFESVLKAYPKPANIQVALGKLLHIFEGLSADQRQIMSVTLEHRFDLDRGADIKILLQQFGAVDRDTLATIRDMLTDKNSERVSKEVLTSAVSSLAKAREEYSATGLPDEFFMRGLVFSLRAMSLEKISPADMGTAALVSGIAFHHAWSHFSHYSRDVDASLAAESLGSMLRYQVFKNPETLVRLAVPLCEAIQKYNSSRSPSRQPDSLVLQSVVDTHLLPEEAHQFRESVRRVLLNHFKSGNTGLPDFIQEFRDTQRSYEAYLSTGYEREFIDFLETPDSQPALLLYRYNDSLPFDVSHALKGTNIPDYLRAISGAQESLSGIQLVEYLTSYADLSKRQHTLSILLRPDESGARGWDILEAVDALEKKRFSWMRKQSPGISKAAVIKQLKLSKDTKILAQLSQLVDSGYLKKRYGRSDEFYFLTHQSDGLLGKTPARALNLAPTDMEQFFKEDQKKLKQQKAKHLKELEKAEENYLKRQREFEAMQAQWQTSGQVVLTLHERMAAAANPVEISRLSREVQEHLLQTRLAEEKMQFAQSQLIQGQTQLEANRVWYEGWLEQANEVLLEMNRSIQSMQQQQADLDLADMMNRMNALANKTLLTDTMQAASKLTESMPEVAKVDPLALQARLIINQTGVRQSVEDQIQTLKAKLQADSPDSLKTDADLSDPTGSARTNHSS